MSAGTTKQVPAAWRGNRRIVGANIDLKFWSGVEFVVDIESSRRRDAHCHLMRESKVPVLRPSPV